MTTSSSKFWFWILLKKWKDLVIWVQISIWQQPAGVKKCCRKVPAIQRTTVSVTPCALNLARSLCLWSARPASASQHSGLQSIATSLPSNSLLRLAQPPLFKWGRAKGSTCSFYFLKMFFSQVIFLCHVFFLVFQESRILKLKSQKEILLPVPALSCFQPSHPFPEGVRTEQPDTSNPETDGMGRKNDRKYKN